MASTRSKYDQCATIKEEHQSTGINNYYMDGTKFENTHKCMDGLGLYGGPFLNLSQESIIDQENKLRGLDRPLSKCPEQKFIGGSCGTNNASSLLCAPKNGPRNTTLFYGAQNSNTLQTCNIITLPQRL